MDKEYLTYDQLLQTDIKQYGIYFEFPWNKEDVQIGWNVILYADLAERKGYKMYRVLNQEPTKKKRWFNW